MEKRISIKTLYLIAVIAIGLVVLGVGSTYAMFTAVVTIDNPIYLASNLTYTSDIMETVDVTIEPGETEYIILEVANSYSSSLNYAMWYIDTEEDIDFGIDGDQGVENICPNLTTCTGFASGSTANIGIYIRNNSASLVTVTVGVSGSSGNVVLANNMEVIPNQDMPAGYTDISNFTYSIDSWDVWGNGEFMVQIPDGSVLLTRYIGTDTVINIPSTYIINDVEYTPIVYGDGPNAEATFMYNNVIEEVNFSSGVLFADFNNEETLIFNSAANLFSGCTSLLRVTGLSDSIENMFYTFSGCTSLVNAPEIPSSVTNMTSTFEECNSLQTISEIPDSVTNMTATFSRCTSLTGTIVIESPNVIDARYAFNNTSQLITVMVSANSTTYTTFDSLTLPSNVTLSIF